VVGFLRPFVTVPFKTRPTLTPKGNAQVNFNLLVLSVLPTI